MSRNLGRPESPNTIYEYGQYIKPIKLHLWKQNDLLALFGEKKLKTAFSIPILFHFDELSFHFSLNIAKYFIVAISGISFCSISSCCTLQTFLNWALNKYVFYVFLWVCHLLLLQPVRFIFLPTIIKPELRRYHTRPHQLNWAPKMFSLEKRI